MLVYEVHRFNARQPDNPPLSERRILLLLPAPVMERNGLLPYFVSRSLFRPSLSLLRVTEVNLFSVGQV